MSRRTTAWLLLVSVLAASGCPRDESRDGAVERPSEVSGTSGEAASAPPEPEQAAQLPLGSHVGERYTASLESVVERRFLRVLTSRNSFDYFIYRGQPGGYQFEMVRAFTGFLNSRHIKGPNQLKIQFELIPVSHDQLIPMLLAGKADMIAARLTITSERAAELRFSIPYRRVDELLVTRQGVEVPSTLEGLSGRRVAIRRTSSYTSSLEGLNEQLRSQGKPPIRVDFVDEALETEKILALVARGRFEFSVADSIVAETAAAIHPELRVLTNPKLRAGGELAWASHPAASVLVDEMNAFLPRYQHGSLQGNVAIGKYFQNISALRGRLDPNDPAGLSRHDDQIKRYAKDFGFDWRLMVSVAYQESRFDQAARNRSGAVGVFQIKPETAAEPYIDLPNVAGPENAGNNIHAGIKYLAWIKGRYFDVVPEMRERDRVRMALAAYNAGPRTLINARRRAEKLGLDPLRWFRNVELALLDMRKPEPVKYVSEINQRYVSYMVLDVK